jgi:TRAP-type transport system periplasmic protein
MKRFALGPVVTMMALLLLCIQTNSPIANAAEEQVIRLKFSNVFPAPHRVGMLHQQWCRDVEKATNGRVKFSYFPGGTLTPPAQTYDSVVKGIADVGASVFAYTRGKFPLTEVIDLPLGYKNGYVANKLINEYYAKFKPKELEEVKVLWLHATTPGFLMTAKKPVHTMEDVKGMKIRSTGLSGQVVLALGGTPVGMPVTETYDALMKGVADGTMLPIEALKGFKMGEVLSYVTLNYSSTYVAGEFVVMNKEKWNALPADIKKIIDKLSEDYLEPQAKLWDEVDVEGKDFFLQKGGKFINLTKEEDARWARQVKPILDEYLKNTAARGLPGEEVLKFAQEYLRAHQN